MSGFGRIDIRSRDPCVDGAVAVVENKGFLRQLGGDVTAQIFIRDKNDFLVGQGADNL